MPVIRVEMFKRTQDQKRNLVDASENLITWIIVRFSQSY